MLYYRSSLEESIGMCVVATTLAQNYLKVFIFRDSKRRDKPGGNGSKAIKTSRLKIIINFIFNQHTHLYKIKSEIV